MTVNCKKCGKTIETKEDLIVMRQWGILVQPLHKACWGAITSQSAGMGSVSYGTGAFQKKNQSNFAINTTIYWIIGIVFFIIGLYVFSLDISNSVVQNGKPVAIDELTQFGLKLIILVIFSIPLIQRLYSALNYESKY